LKHTPSKHLSEAKGLALCPHPPPQLLGQLPIHAFPILIDRKSGKKNAPFARKAAIKRQMQNRLEVSKAS
jgi:hypothetical protein